jgi:hypothetical protein
MAEVNLNVQKIRDMQIPVILRKRSLQITPGTRVYDASQAAPLSTPHF